MSEHRLPRDPRALNPEVFQCHEAATGKSLPMREATDEQLAKFIADAEGQAAKFMTEALKLIGLSGNCGKAASCMQYELDRRKRTGGLVSTSGGPLN